MAGLTGDSPTPCASFVRGARGLICVRAAIAAAVCCLAVFAADAEDKPNYKYGTGFEKLETGQSFLDEAQAGDSATVELESFWVTNKVYSTSGIVQEYASTGGGSTSVDSYSAINAEYYRTNSKNSKYLEVDTANGYIARTVAAKGGGYESVSNDVSAFFYFDSLVKFSLRRTSDPNELASGWEYVTSSTDGDKIAVWLRELVNSDGTSVTNLMITAGYNTAGLKIAPTNFVVKSYGTGSANVKPDEWHRLTIKASELQYTGDTGDSAYTLAFNVYLDGEGGNYTPIRATPQAGSEEQTEFFSAGSIGKESTKKIKQAKFVGRGGVDDIVWTHSDIFEFLSEYFRVGEFDYVNWQAALAKFDELGGTMQLLDDFATNVLAVTAGRDMVFDLAGHTLDGCLENSRNLVITNSAVAEATITGSVTNKADTTLDLVSMHVRYLGSIERDYGTVNVYGGRFLADKSFNTTNNVTLVDGWKWDVDNSESDNKDYWRPYLLLPDDHSFTVFTNEEEFVQSIDTNALPQTFNVYTNAYWDAEGGTNAVAKVENGGVKVTWLGGGETVTTQYKNITNYILWLVGYGSLEGWYSSTNVVMRSVVSTTLNSASPVLGYMMSLAPRMATAAAQPQYDEETVKATADAASVCVMQALASAADGETVSVKDVPALDGWYEALWLGSTPANMRTVGANLPVSGNTTVFYVIKNSDSAFFVIEISPKEIAPSE